MSDQAGNQAPEATQTLTVDETAPTAPGVALTSDTGSSSSDHITNNPALTLSGVESGAKVEYSLDGGTTWSTSAPTLAQLVQGSNTVDVRQTDVAGNVSGLTAFNFTLDTVAPAIAITTPIAGDNVVNAAEAATGFAINGTTTGIADGQTATIVLVNSANAVVDTYTPIVGGNAWSITVTSTQAQALANGSYTVKADVSDVAGNAAGEASQALSVNKAALSIAITTPIAGDNIVNAAEAAAGFSIQGTTTGVADGQIATITIVNSANTVLFTFNPVVSGNAWSVTVPGTDHLVDGSYTIKADVSDQAGNQAPEATRTLTVDETAPTAPGVALTSDTGSSSSDHITNNPALTLSGVESGAKVEYSLDGGTSWSTSAPTLAQLVQGSNTVDVRQTDVAGNVSGLNAFNFTLDTVAPTIAITTPIAGDNIVNAAEAATGFAINGTTTGIADGQTATIVLVNSANAVVDTYTPIVGGNAWSITVTSTQAQALANGSYTVKADVSDVAGNAAGEASQALSVNKAALSIAITTPIAGDNIVNAAEAAAGFSIQGTTTGVADGQIATITIVNSANTVLFTFNPVVSGNAWSVTVPGTDHLVDGSYTIKADVSDQAGNQAPEATRTLTVDETAPTAPGVALTSDTGSSSSDHITNNPALTLSRVESGAKVEYSLDGGNSWSTSAPTLAQLVQGSNTVDVRQTDVAGNVSGLNAFNFTLDTVAPAIAITTPIAGDNVVNAAEAATGFAINGTTTGIADGQTATIVLVNSANAVVDTYTPIVGGNAWSITVTSTQAQALANGSYTVKADVSDVAGNAASEASQALTVNKAALSIAITTPIASDNIVNAAEAAAGFSIQGTTTGVADGQIATITIVNSANTVLFTFNPVVSGNAWSVTVPGTDHLPDGSYTIKADVSDRVGNQAPEATQTLTVDETAPAIPGVALTNDTGSSSSDHITSNPALTLTNIESGGQGRVLARRRHHLVDQRADGSPAGAGVNTLMCGRPMWPATFQGSPPSPLPSTRWRRRLRSRHRLPATILSTRRRPRAGFAINGTTTGIADGQTATIVLVNSANAVVDTYTPIVSGNAWSITVTSTQAQALANGSYTVKADVSDVAGNAAGEASQALTVNKAALSIAITTPDCRRQYCQRGGGGGGILDPGHHHRGCRRADRDDHDRQQCQHGVVHLQPRCQRQCLVGDGAGHRSSARWQLYHQSRCVGWGRQPGAGSDANSDGR